MSEVKETLVTRGKRYGSFDDHAALSVGLKEVMKYHDNYEHLPPYMQEALEMFCHKMARIVNGDPYYIDSWRDIAGYAQLVMNKLQEVPGASDARVKVVTRGEDAWERWEK